MHRTARICVEGKLLPNVFKATHMRRSKAYAWKKSSALSKTRCTYAWKMQQHPRSSASPTHMRGKRKKQGQNH
ncbi:hypothetical protein PIB30_107000, partial [Stylosanthes scabra]|nr:hypothetical protein [Stylosanthes scabra]